MAVLLGAKPPIVFKEYVLATSQTWTAPSTGTIMVTCTGGGGQGGAASNNQVGTNSASRARGGGAGGFSQKTIPVKVGDTFTVVIGAGGRSSNTAPSNSTQGTTGGESTFDDATAISDIALDSNGGVGGAAQNASAGSSTLAGGAGGTASGGDLNVVGGAGGAIITPLSSNRDVSTGGGAVSMYGIAFAGGAATSAGNGTCQLTTGGAGCFGAGGAYVHTGSNGTSFSGGTQGGGNTRAGQTYGPDDMSTANVKQDNNRGGATYNYNHPAGNNGLGSTQPQGLEGTQITGPRGSNTGIIDQPESALSSTGSGSSGATTRLNIGTDFIRVGGGGAFAGGGGCTVVANSNGAGQNTSNPSKNGKGGLGGGGSGGFCQHDSFIIDWQGGGQGLVIVSYIG